MKSPSQAMREQMQAALEIVNEEKRTLSAELGRLVMELDSTKSSLAAVEEGSKEALSLKAKITEQQRTFSKDLSKIQSLALAQKVSEEKARIKVSKLAADADRYKSKLAAHRLQSAAYNKRLKGARPADCLPRHKAGGCQLPEDTDTCRHVGVYWVRLTPQ